MSFKERLKSPVVIGAIILNLLGLFYFIMKNWIGYEIPQWDAFVGLVMVLYNIFAGVNDPTNKTGF